MKSSSYGDFPGMTNQLFGGRLITLHSFYQEEAGIYPEGIDTNVSSSSNYESTEYHFCYHDVPRSIAAVLGIDFPEQDMSNGLSSMEFTVLPASH